MEKVIRPNDFKGKAAGAGFFVMGTFTGSNYEYGFGAGYGAGYGAESTQDDGAGSEFGNGYGRGNSAGAGAFLKRYAGLGDTTLHCRVLDDDICVHETGCCTGLCTIPGYASEEDKAFDFTDD